MSLFTSKGGLHVASKGFPKALLVLCHSRGEPGLPSDFLLLCSGRERLIHYAHYGLAGVFDAICEVTFGGLCGIAGAEKYGLLRRLGAVARRHDGCAW